MYCSTADLYRPAWAKFGVIDSFSKVPFRKSADAVSPSSCRVALGGMAMVPAAEASRYSASPPLESQAYTGLPAARNARTASRTSETLAHPQSIWSIWSTSASMRESRAARRRPSTTR